MNAFFKWLVVAYAPLHARYALVEESRGAGVRGNATGDSPLARSSDPIPLVDRDTLDDGATERFTACVTDIGTRKPRYNLIANSPGKGCG